MSTRVQGYRMPTGRPVTMGTRGMVATSHYLASAAGMTMLQQAGSAADALIAANATLCVVYGHMAGLGGDMFAQVVQDNRVEALNGSGRSGENVTSEAYRAKGWNEIPSRGPLAANTVPGVVDGWRQLHERYGKLEWEALFGPAIHYAREGFPITQKFRDYIAGYRTTLQRFEATARTLLVNGQAPAAGALLCQPDLADSLAIIAQQGAQAFYQGALAEKLVRGLEQAGGLLTRDDFAAYHSDWVTPLRTNYRGYEVTELPPNTQGIATLLILNLIDGLDLQQIVEGSADYYHVLTEAVKLAFADRDEWVTDPATIDIPYDRLLSKDYAAQRRARIDPRHAADAATVEPGITPSASKRPVSGRTVSGTSPGSEDTCFMAAVDADGLGVSMIQSVYFEFGSAFMPEGTGILLQNRGSFFKLDPDHPNALAPRKRTFHTIIPALALRGDRPALLFGTMGGEGQPQTQTALLTRIVDYGFNVQEAIEAPRWLYGRTWGEQSRSLKLEGRIPDGVGDELKRRGHDVQYVEDWSQTMGHAQAIWIDHEAGTLHGGADPRGDGMAIGW